MGLKLVIDGNSLLNVITTATIYSSKNADLSRPFYRVMDKWAIKSTSAEYYDSQLYRYLSGILRSFPGIDGVYIASDSMSWRKVFYKNMIKMFEGRADYSDIETGYKGKRKIDNEQKQQNIELIKYLTSETLFRLSQKIPGLSLIGVKGLEGDDIVYRLTERLKANNDVIVWSNDSDLHQILDKNVYIIGSQDPKTKTRRMFQINENQDVHVQKGVMSFDFARNTDSGIKQTIASLLQRGFYSNTYCDPYYDIITKILCGDKASDNIPPVYSVKGSTGKVVNLTRAKYSDKIIEYLKENGYTEKSIVEGFKVYEEKLMNMIVEKICELFKVSYNDNHEIICKYLKFNIRMILLDEKMIPAEILQYLDDVITYIDGKNTRFDFSTFENFVQPYILEKNNFV